MKPDHPSETLHRASSLASNKPHCVSCLVRPSVAKQAAASQPVQCIGSIQRFMF